MLEKISLPEPYNANIIVTHTITTFKFIMTGVNDHKFYVEKRLS